MGKCVLLVLIATSLFLLSNCSKVQQAPEAKVEKMVYSNNFSTLEIRSFWHMCSLTFRQKNPFTQPEFLVEHCDCYSDYIRKTYKSIFDWKNGIQAEENGSPTRVIENEEFWKEINNLYLFKKVD